jgi:hypothetical protein
MPGPRPIASALSRFPQFATKLWGVIASELVELWHGVYAVFTAGA